MVGRVEELTPLTFLLFTLIQTRTTILPFSSFRKLPDEINRAADQQSEFLVITLQSFEKYIAENVVADIANNSEISKALACLFEVPLISCHSHRFALVVKEYLEQHDKLLSEINTLMAKLKNGFAKIHYISPFSI